MPAKLDDEIKKLHMVVPTAWVAKVDAWRRKKPGPAKFVGGY